MTAFSYACFADIFFQYISSSWMFRVYPIRYVRLLSKARGFNCSSRGCYREHDRIRDGSRGDSK